ncbi:MAG: heat-inducible transcriptional repressor HrcA [Thermoanaerobaculia bacterium]
MCPIPDPTPASRKGAGAASLSPRERAILRDIIHSYVLTGEPVSSRSLARMSEESVSAATIRNTMADLEERGYLAQPHSSAGRIPTPAAYHRYIGEMMRVRKVPLQQRRYIAEHLREATPDPEGLVNLATRMLSQLSEQIGLAVAPPLGETVLKAIDFVAVSDRQVLCVLVSASGFVEHRILDVEEAMPREELVRISNFLTDRFAGRTLTQIRHELIETMVATKREMDHLLSTAVELAKRALVDAPAPGVFVEGTASILQKPELTDINRVRRLLETFADEARLVQLLNQLIEGPGLQVIIGDDSDLTSELDFSLVATTYKVGGRTLGTLGIFGPSRMEYRRIIPLVSHLGESLSRALGGEAV